MKSIVNVIDFMSDIAGKLSAWGIFLVGLFICYEIIVRIDFVRAVFGSSPTVWVDEVCRVILIWATYLSAGYVLKCREMVTIDIILKNSQSVWRRLAETLAILMMLMFASVASYYGFQLWLKSTLSGHTTDSYLAIPKLLTQASIWVGFGLFFLQALAELYKVWAEQVRSFPTKNEGVE